jgi:hypothetical protein
MQYPAYEEKDRAEKMAFLRDYIKYLQMRDQVIADYMLLCYELVYVRNSCQISLT